MNHRWLCGARVIDCGQPRVMAILNATPDSFFAGSRFVPGADGRAQLAALIAAGPDLLDIGGQSTRPGAEQVGADEERARIVPAIELARELAPELPVSVDTYYSAVAEAALTAGADIINDVSAGRFDPQLIPLAADTGCGYVLMHMLGEPGTMQDAPQYRDCLAEVGGFFAEQLELLEDAGVSREQVVLDPGIGFGKTLEHNLSLIAGAAGFHRFGRPLLYGISRKRLIGELAEEPDAALRLPGTLGLSWELLSQGVMLHRVHDPAALRQLIAVWRGVYGRRVALLEGR
jgi:dihydropteroate synthase